MQLSSFPRHHHTPAYLNLIVSKFHWSFSILVQQHYCSAVWWLRQDCHFNLCLCAFGSEQDGLLPFLSFWVDIPKTNYFAFLPLNILIMGLSIRLAGCELDHPWVAHIMTVFPVTSLPYNHACHTEQHTDVYCTVTPVYICKCTLHTNSTNHTRWYFVRQNKKCYLSNLYNRFCVTIKRFYIGYNSFRYDHTYDTIHWKIYRTMEIHWPSAITFSIRIYCCRIFHNSRLLLTRPLILGKEDLLQVVLHHTIQTTKLWRCINVCCARIYRKGQSLIHIYPPTSSTFNCQRQW